MVTPVQVGRNVFGMLRGPDRLKPSAKLEKAIRMNIAAQAITQQKEQNAAAAGSAPE